MQKQIEIRSVLKKLHDQENDLNTEMTKLDKVITNALKRKGKIVKRISANMKYRNRLINKLTQL